MKKQTKSITVQACVTPAVFDIITHMADTEDISISTWLNKLILKSQKVAK